MPNPQNRQNVAEPQIFKTVQASASGNTAVWTPATGNRFRLLKYRIMITGNATVAAAGVVTITFQDATTATNLSHDVYLNTSALGTVAFVYDSGWTDLGKFGYWSTTANNALNVNLSVALTAGNVRVEVAGVEF